MIKRGIALDGARDLEAGRAQKPNALPDLPIDWDKHLGREKTVVARPALRGISDVVPEEVAVPYRDPGHPERRARVVGIDYRQPVRDHCSPPHRHQVRVLVLDRAAEVRPGLLYSTEVVSEPAQKVHDVGAV